jgi:hypothetical protein
MRRLRAQVAKKDVLIESGCQNISAAQGKLKGQHSITGNSGQTFDLLCYFRYGAPVRDGNKLCLNLLKTVGCRLKQTADGIFTCTPGQVFDGQDFFIRRSQTDVDGFF